MILISFWINSSPFRGWQGPSKSCSWLPPPSHPTHIQSTTTMPASFHFLSQAEEDLPWLHRTSCSVCLECFPYPHLFDDRTCAWFHDFYWIVSSMWLFSSPLNSPPPPHAHCFSPTTLKMYVSIGYFVVFSLLLEFKFRHNRKLIHSCLFSSGDYSWNTIIFQWIMSFN